MSKKKIIILAIAAGILIVILLQILVLGKYILNRLHKLDP